MTEMKEKANYKGNLYVYTSLNKHSTKGTISLIMASLIASLILLPIQDVFAHSHHSDRHHSDRHHSDHLNISDLKRNVETRSTTSDIFSDLPLHAESNTITGNNGGAVITGTSRDDIIIGTTVNDRIFGRDGSDVINGANGADTIEGAEGDDTIQGAEGDDQIYGEDGNDILSGGLNDDYLSGGSGNNELYGGDNDDTLKGGPDKDHFDCGLGFDTVLDFNVSKGDTHSADCEVIYQTK